MYVCIYICMYLFKKPNYLTIISLVNIFVIYFYTGLFEMIVGVLTTATLFSRCNPM